MKFDGDPVFHRITEEITNKLHTYFWSRADIYIFFLNDFRNNDKF